MIRCVQSVLRSFRFIILCLHFTANCFVCVSHFITSATDYVFILIILLVFQPHATETLRLLVFPNYCHWSFHVLWRRWFFTFVNPSQVKHLLIKTSPRRESLCRVFVISCHSSFTAAHCQTARVTADEVIRAASQRRTGPKKLGFIWYHWQGAASPAPSLTALFQPVHHPTMPSYLWAAWILKGPLCEAKSLSV